jgi:hypothetical protein
VTNRANDIKNIPGRKYSDVKSKKLASGAMKGLTITAQIIDRESINIV